MGAPVLRRSSPIESLARPRAAARGLTRARLGVAVTKSPITMRYEAKSKRSFSRNTRYGGFKPAERQKQASEGVVIAQGAMLTGGC